MQKWLSRLFLLSIVLLPFHKWIEKPFRSFSRSLIYADIHLTPDFPKRVGVFLMDIPLLLFLIGVFLWGKWRWREILLQKQGKYGWMLLGIAVLSILGSTYPFYGLHYIRLVHTLGLPVLIFCLLAQGEGFTEELTGKIFRVLLGVAIFECCVGIGQYFLQGSLGLYFLGEPDLNLSHSASFPTPDGSRWVFDQLFHVTRPTSSVLRASGTFPHANIFGGFLFFSLMGTYFLFQKSQRKWLFAIAIFLQLFTLLITYSRSALIAWMIASAFYLIFLYIQQEDIEELPPYREEGDSPSGKERQVSCRSLIDSSLNSALKGRDCVELSVRKLGFAIGGSFALCFGLLCSQLLYRKGIAPIFWMGAGLVIASLIYFYREKRWGWFSLLLGSLGLLGGLSYDQISEKGRQITELADEGRLHFQAAAMKMIQENPFLGVGYNNYLLHRGNFNSDQGIVHNIYLLMAAEVGLFGLCVFLLFIGSVLKRGWEKRGEEAGLVCFTIFLGFLFIGLCDFYLFWHHCGRFMFFIVAGLLSASLSPQSAKS